MRLLPVLESLHNNIEGIRQTGDGNGGLMYGSRSVHEVLPGEYVWNAAGRRERHL